MNAVRTLTLIGGFACALATLAASAVPQSVPGMYFQGATTIQPEPALLLAPGATTRTIELPAITTRVRTPEMKSQTAQGSLRPGPREIGVVRDVASRDSVIDLPSLAWRSTADGGLAAQVAIRSIGAEGLRVEVGLSGSSAGIAFRFAGRTVTGDSSPGNAATTATTGTIGNAFGPYTWTEMESMSRWSPVIDGDTMTIEVALAPGLSPAGRSLTVAHVAHHDVSLVRETAAGLKATGPGGSGSCNIDIACVAAQQPGAAQTAASTARITFVMGSLSYDCSGSLINSIDAQGTPTQIPYFITANHCISTAAAAGTIQFYWFYQTAACKGTTAPTTKTTTGGGTLLYTSVDVDATLLRLNVTPPAGVFLAGWDATPPMPGTSLVSLHHPSGDYTKYSAGIVTGFGHFCEFVNASNVCSVWQGSYIRVNWTQGTTEGGSSGAGVYSTDVSGAYRLRGVLHGGGASCESPNDPDFFSRFDLAYPGISQYVAGIAQPAGGANAIEFYNVDLDHYFLTSSASEAAGIEAGAAGIGWVRTGYGFPIGNGLGAGQLPVCRFYGPGPNSHFYTADAGECAFVKTDPGWLYEGTAYSVRVPTAQACPANTIPILRAYNNGFVNNNSNHRYTTSQYIYEWMQTQPSVTSIFLGRPESVARWSGESTVMCAPISG